MYKEIQELYKWCVAANISCTLESLYDGYKIKFSDGADMVQHCGSYRGKEGYIEPAGFSEEYDYSPVALIYCWVLIRARYR